MTTITRKLAGNVVTIFNGGSFVAQNVVARLGKAGAQMVLGYRGAGYREEKSKMAAGVGQMYLAKYHLKDEDSLYEAMKHSNIVINCIGKENETKNFSFNDVHVEGPRRMARIAREIGVEKFIHLSAMNVSPNPTPICLKNGSQFLRSKYYGELAVREEFPEAIIFRPADVLGDRDNFINHFGSMQRCRYTRKLAIWDYYYQVKKRPIWIKDLVSGIEQAILQNTANGKTFQAVGPYEYDFYDLIEYIRSCAGQGKKLDEGEITNLRWDPWMRMVIFMVERLQKYPFLTWERVERDSHSDILDRKLPTLTDLGVELTPIEMNLMTLAYYRPRMHRHEVPYEKAQVIDWPKRLNVAV